MAERTLALAVSARKGPEEATGGKSETTIASAGEDPEDDDEAEDDPPDDDEDDAEPPAPPAESEEEEPASLPSLLRGGADGSGRAALSETAARWAIARRRRDILSFPEAKVTTQNSCARRWSRL